MTPLSNRQPFTWTGRKDKQPSLRSSRGKTCPKRRPLLQCAANHYIARRAGAQVCLEFDPARRGVIESHVGGGYWAVRFSNTSRKHRKTDLKLLTYDAAFEPSEAPLLSALALKKLASSRLAASATDFLERGLSVTASTHPVRCKGGFVVRVPL